MIGVTLQNYLKRIYLFPLAQNVVICFQKPILWFRTQGALFPDLFSFKTQRYKLSKKMRLEFETKKIEKKCDFSSEPNNFMLIVESKKVRLGFKIRIVDF